MIRNFIVLNKQVLIDDIANIGKIMTDRGLGVLLAITAGVLWST